MSSNHDLSRGQTLAVEGMARLAVPTKLTQLVLGFCFLLPASFAQAATITHAKLDATTEIIRIEGDIVTGDLEQFRQISLRYPNAVVSLNSNGGLIYPAIEIGKIIKIMGYVTMVSDRYVCASACALIWMAGNRRLASGRGNVGFHASYRTDNGRPVESGAANALIGNYLTLLGASAKTVVFTTTAPPDKVLWLTAANKEASGIDFQFTAPVQPQAATSPLKPPQIQTVLPTQVPVIAPPPPMAPVLLRFRAATPKGNPGSWATGQDYPALALREGREGTTGFHLTIGPHGRVTNCQITSSSGSPDLDEVTCSNILVRARFYPATNSRGQPTTGYYANRVRWSIPRALESASTPPDAVPSINPPDSPLTIISVERVSVGENKIFLYKYKYLGLMLSSFLENEDNNDPVNNLIEFFNYRMNNEGGWFHYYFSGVSGNRFYSYLNAKSMIRKSGIVSIWIKNDHQYDNRVKYRESLLHFNIYCDSIQYSIDTEHRYDANGNSIYSQSYNEGLKHIVPDTVDYRLWEAVCSN